MSDLTSEQILEMVKETIDLVAKATGNLIIIASHTLDEVQKARMPIPPVALTNPPERK